MGEMGQFEVSQVNQMIELQSSFTTPKALRDKFEFLRVKDIDSLSLANAVQNRYAKRIIYEIGMHLSTYWRRKKESGIIGQPK